mmetsp:Transcript_46448/g.104395  ORF Transcript_46448/g.104395 Transcript_46448/m.104395 type:complete len:276 (+) Transcript_46448:56-883(+)
MAGAMEDDDGIDTLCELLDAGPGGESPRSDVDALLGCLAPGGALSTGSGSDVPRLTDGSSPGKAGAGRSSQGHALSDLPPDALVLDLPEPVIEMPPEVTPIPFVMLARFSLRCEIDLKKVAFGVRNAEYNPRKHPSVTIRLLDPRTTALVRTSGIVTLQGRADEEQLRNSAKKIARLVQRCGYPEAKFAEYAVTSIMAKVDLGFPIRLEALATKWRRNAMYEPEIFCSCVFRTRNPPACYLVSSGGKVVISGFRRIFDIKEALKRVYSVLSDFQK